MPAHRPGHVGGPESSLRAASAVRPAGTAPGRSVARAAAVALTAGLIVGGCLVTPAVGFGGVPAAAGYGGVAGSIGATAEHRVLSAQTARLAGQAAVAARSARAESLAVADAALAAAAAAAPLVGQAGDPAVPDELSAAVQRLDRLVRATGPAVTAPLQAPVTVPAAPLAARPDAAVPGGAAAAGSGSADALPAGSPASHGALTDALADAAGEVFRLSMQVETLSGVTTQDATVAQTRSLEALETAVSTVGQVAAATELTPLTPLTPEERLALALDESGATEVRWPARLRGDAPPGVAALMATWSNGRVPLDELCAVPFAPGHRLQCDAAAALAGLNAAYRARFGTDLTLVSSYRELETQVSLRATKGGLAAVPGTSNHGWGLAVDIAGIGGLGEFGAPGYLWLKEHAGAHGWHHPRAMEPGGGGPQEPWHWEFGTA